MVAISSWWRRILLAGTFLISSCTGTIGADAPADDFGAGDVGSLEVEAPPDIALPLDVMDVMSSGDLGDDGRVVPEVSGDLPQGPQTTGCIQCHTDKDRLYELAPPEPPTEEEESGGG